jgi:hypothetical protein
MRMRMRWMLQGMGVAAIAWALIGASIGSAQSIFIENHDFEAPVQTAGGFTQGGVPGWSTAGGSSWGVFRPTVPTWGYVAPSGQQLLYSNGPMIQQTLAATAVAGQRYSLAVRVVNRPTYGSLDYSIELWAGTTLLGFDDASLVPPVGGSLTSLIVVDVAPGSPAVGQPFIIRLGGPSQVNFDDVRLVPEPVFASGLVAVVGLAALGRRRGSREARERHEGGARRHTRDSR